MRLLLCTPSLPYHDHAEADDDDATCEAKDADAYDVAADDHDEDDEVEVEEWGCHMPVLSYYSTPPHPCMLYSATTAC